MANTAYKIRQAKGEDLSFIYDTWLKSFRYDSPLGKSCKNSIFFNEYKEVLDRILSQAETLVAHSSDNEDHIFAYLTFQPGILHYMFCKEAFRRMGIGRALYLSAFSDELAKIDHTHRTGMVSEWLRLRDNMTHNPFHLFNKGAI